MSFGTGQGAASASRVAAWLALALVAVALANGAVAYLKRVGVLDRPTYDRYLSAYCAPSSPGTPAHPCACMRVDPAQLDDAVRHATDTPLEPKFVYLNRGGELAFKALKDGLFLGTLVLGALLWRHQGGTPVRWRDVWPMLALGMSLVIGLIIGCRSAGGAVPWLGLRAFAFLPLALLAVPLVPHLDRIARGLVLLLLAQLLLVGIEFAWGLPLRTCPLSFRVAGTMVLPNSLGALALVALAFVGTYGDSRRWLAAAWLAALALVALTGSGIGWIGLLAYAAFSMWHHAGPRLRRVAPVAAAALGVLLMLGLPMLTQRPDIYDSVFAKGGRLDTLSSVYAGATPAQRLWGRGLGVGANATISYADAALMQPANTGAVATPIYTDSTVTALLMQLGLAGVLAFYVMLAWAFRRDVAARPAWAIFALASLTMNLLELFPINFLLGLALARALAPTATSSSGGSEQ